MTAAPAKNPCGSCPYRKDVPSGVWAPEEYDKLPMFDGPTSDQPPAVFYCHQQNGRVCAGWAGCHDMTQNLGLRIAVSMGKLTPEEYDAVVDYESPVPLFESGAAAAEHGLRDLFSPSEKAQRVIDRVLAKPSPMAPRRRG